MRNILWSLHHELVQLLLLLLDCQQHHLEGCVIFLLLLGLPALLGHQVFIWLYGLGLESFHVCLGCLHFFSDAHQLRVQLSEAALNVLLEGGDLSIDGRWNWLRKRCWFQPWWPCLAPAWAFPDWYLWTTTDSSWVFVWRSALKPVFRVLFWPSYDVLSFLKLPAHFKSFFSSRFRPYWWTCNFI